MKIIVYTIFFIFITFSINNLSFADSSIVKIKKKIQSSEKKLIDGIWGSNDCSHISTKSLSGLAKYKKCKSGEDVSEKNITKKKKNKLYDPNKSCDEYSTKTFTGLAAKMKCLKTKKN